MVRNNAFGNDEFNDENSHNNVAPYDPCSSNPCKNDGTCALGIANSFSCYCIPDYIGNNKYTCLY